MQQAQELNDLETENKSSVTALQESQNLHETDTSVCISGKPDQAVLGKRLASDQVQINPSALKRPKRKSAFLS